MIASTWGGANSCTCGPGETCGVCFAAARQAARVARSAERVVLRVAELPDRTSPEDWPEAMLVTSEELREIVVVELGRL